MTASLIEKLTALTRVSRCRPRRWVPIEDVLAIVREHEAGRTLPEINLDQWVRILDDAMAYRAGRVAAATAAESSLPSEAYRMPDGRPIFGEGSPHGIGEHLDRLAADHTVSEAYRKVEEALQYLRTTSTWKRQAALCDEALAALPALKPAAAPATEQPVDMSALFLAGRQIGIDVTSEENRLFALLVERYEAAKAPATEQPVQKPLVIESQHDKPSPPFLPREPHSLSGDTRCSDCPCRYGIHCHSAPEREASALTEAEKEHAVYLIAEKQANGWEYGTHPREKARIVLSALLERFHLTRKP